jgi:OOP family OmpA-OmpF porin
MDFDGKGTLTLRGTAPMAWILRTRENARALPGVNQVDTQALIDPQMNKILDMSKEVEAITIEFPSDKDTPVPEDLPKLQKAVDTLVNLEQMARHMGLVISLTIYGHADATGSSRRNYEISQARTRTIAAMLYARGSSMPIAMYGMGSELPKGNEKPEPPDPKAKPGGSQASRRIEFRVHLSGAVSANSETVLK